MKKLFDFIEKLDGIGVYTGAECVVEIVDNVVNGISDFIVDDYRFINANSIDKILADELVSDKHVLGCFSDWMIADAAGVPRDLVSIIQEEGAFEALGRWMARDRELVSRLAELSVRYSDYGCHFAGYDGQQHEMSVNDALFYVFRVN